jgi:hypothetical protein
LPAGVPDARLGGIGQSPVGRRVDLRAGERIGLSSILNAARAGTSPAPGRSWDDLRPFPAVRIAPLAAPVAEPRCRPPPGIRSGGRCLRSSSSGCQPWPGAWRRARVRGDGTTSMFLHKKWFQPISCASPLREWPRRAHPPSAAFSGNVTPRDTARWAHDGALRDTTGDRTARGGPASRRSRSRAGGRIGSPVLVWTPTGPGPIDHAIRRRSPAQLVERGVGQGDLRPRAGDRPHRGSAWPKGTGLATAATATWNGRRHGNLHLGRLPFVDVATSTLARPLPREASIS